LREKSALLNDEKYMGHHATIEDLAHMINEGFKTTATKEGVKALEDRLTTRLDRLEHLLQR
jgi:hypothetical protein